jgi:hypothetical protein
MASINHSATALSLRERAGSMLGLGSARPLFGSARIVIERPIDRVFDFVGREFFDHYRQWCPQIVELEPLSSEPTGVGVKARQVTLDRSICSEATFEITEFAPPQTFGIVGITEPFESAYKFQKRSEAATEIAFSFEVLELELFMRPFQSLIRTALQDGAEQTVESIKQLLESKVSPAPALQKWRLPDPAG